jgi:hypothetical protein
MGRNPPHPHPAILTISDFCRYDVGAVTVASPYGFFLERPGLVGAVQPINRTQR